MRRSAAESWLVRVCRPQSAVRAVHVRCSPSSSSSVCAPFPALLCRIPLPSSSTQVPVPARPTLTPQ